MVSKFFSILLDIFFINTLCLIYAVKYWYFTEKRIHTADGTCANEGKSNQGRISGIKPWQVLTILLLYA